MKNRGSIGLAAALTVGLALAFSPPLAAALEPTAERTAYVELAEPVCKTNVSANKRIFEGAKGEVKAGELKKAAAHFSRAATAFGKTISQLEGISQPPGDAVRLQKWFSLLRKEKTIIEKIGRALKDEQKHRAESYSVDLNQNSNKANNAVLGFGFDYCRIEPSRFG